MKPTVSFDRQEHWEKVYAQRTPPEVSWYQAHPSISYELIVLTGIGPSRKIIDVGGGASVLVDKLLDNGYKDVTVLDISSKAIDYAKERLGQRAEQVTWVISDITEFEPPRPYDLWHDRAVFHFLTDPNDRQNDVEAMKKALKPGGHAVISAFSLQGPPKCSGLHVERYNAEKMRRALGEGFEVVKSIAETHTTPSKIRQEFIYCYFKRREA